MIPIDCQCFYHSSFLCCYGYSCGVLSAIHLDLGLTHTRASDPCLSTIGPQSPVHFTSVTCPGSLEEVVQVRYTCSVIANRALAWNS